MQTNEAKNENLEWNVENQLELLLVKMRDQKEDLGNCPICNERASGIYYGLATCEGCRGFFRRTVQIELYYNYKCTLNQNCIIDKSTRNRCHYCRFQKCLAMGMKIEAVPSEGRNKLGCYYKYDRLKVSDSDDGHGKEEDDAEMENTEDADDDFVRIDFSELNICNGEQEIPEE